MGFSVEEETPRDVEPPKVETGAEHLDAIRAADLDPVAGGEDAVRGIEDIEAGEIAEERLSRDQFFEVFQLSFGLPGMFVPAFAPVAIQDHEQAQARGASDATYRLLELYFPRALSPAGETATLLLTAGPFFIAKAMIVRHCLASGRAKPQAQAEKAADPGAGYASPFAFADQEAA